MCFAASRGARSVATSISDGQSVAAFQRHIATPDEQAVLGEKREEGASGSSPAHDVRLRSHAHNMDGRGLTDAIPREAGLLDYELLRLCQGAVEAWLRASWTSFRDRVGTVIPATRQHPWLCHQEYDFLRGRAEGAAPTSTG